jgi:hypothetical protein
MSIQLYTRVYPRAHLLLLLPVLLRAPLLSIFRRIRAEMFMREKIIPTATRDRSNHISPFIVIRRDHMFERGAFRRHAGKSGQS